MAHRIPAPSNLIRSRSKIFTVSDPSHTLCWQHEHRTSQWATHQRSQNQARLHREDDSERAAHHWCFWRDIDGWWNRFGSMGSCWIHPDPPALYGKCGQLLAPTTAVNLKILTQLRMLVCELRGLKSRHNGPSPQQRGERDSTLASQVSDATEITQISGLSSASAEGSM